MGIVLLIIIGAAAGFLATRLMRWEADIPTTIVIGVAGALLGGFALRALLMMAGWMAESGFRDGCPIATTLLENAPQVAPIREAGRSAFDAWARVFEARLTAQGLPPERARRLSLTAIAALEGALLMSRVQASGQPLVEVAEEIAIAFDAAITGRRPGPRQGPIE